MILNRLTARQLAAGSLFLFASETPAAVITGRILDEHTQVPLPARVYVINEATGQSFFVETTSENGSALPYREQWVPMPNSREHHTTISAHPFQIELPPGTYDIEVSHGKEYLPIRRTVTLSSEDFDLTFPLRRWINMASRGYYSGETHVHRRHFELPNVIQAEDLNIAFPVTFWTTTAFEAPHVRPSTLRRPPSPFGPRQDLGTATIVVDPNHLIVPRNTEYEIFSIRGKAHTLGAVFILNHNSIFTEGMPPVGQIARQAHEEGALLDLDKHSWPWSFMLAPVAKVDLFELSNNSVWRTRFGFSQAGVIADYMNIPTTNGQMSERGWLEFGFHAYYALLNCGLRMTPTAGTASGVHPVPLGFSRVYVHLDQGLSTRAWLDGLKAGRSFVTTGPMIFFTANELAPSSLPSDAISGPGVVQLSVEVYSQHPVTEIELISNGDRLIHSTPTNTVRPEGGYSARLELRQTFTKSAWIAARCFSQLPNQRERFAHTAPVYVEVPGKPIQPKSAEVDYLTQRLRDEIERNRDILPQEALLEFHQALEFYESFQPGR